MFKLRNVNIMTYDNKLVAPKKSHKLNSLVFCSVETCTMLVLIEFIWSSDIFSLIVIYDSIVVSYSTLLTNLEI